MTAIALLTAEDLWNMPENGGRNELFKGELRPMSPASTKHGLLAMRIGARLMRFADAQHLGIVVGAESGFIISGDTVLAPDAAFVKQSRIPAGGPPERFFPGTPDLAVEVLSPSDSWSAVEEKVHAYLAAGTLLVWVVNPRTQTVTTYRPGPTVKVFRATDTLSGEDVLPGFTLPIAEIFTP